MNKKGQILIVIGAMAVIYLFLLVGIPALANMIPPCGNCNSTETANFTTSNITADWALVDPDLEVRPIREIYKTPLIIYLIPGMIGIATIMIILKQKKEA